MQRNGGTIQVYLLTDHAIKYKTRIHENILIFLKNHKYNKLKKTYNIE